MTKLTGTYSEVAAYEFTTLTTVPGTAQHGTAERGKERERKGGCPAARVEMGMSHRALCMKLALFIYRSSHTFVLHALGARGTARTRGRCHSQGIVPGAVLQVCCKCAAPSSRCARVCMMDGSVSAQSVLWGDAV
jgi:hypothetical protein